jgi:cardiolipin synthase
MFAVDTTTYLNTYTANNSVQLIRGGKRFFLLLERIIQEAKETIHLQVYIYAEDETGIMIADALMEAARRGVKVYLMADGYASQSLSNNFIRQLSESGISFRFFEPVFKGSNFYFGRRLHHKLVVVDNAIALVGGINISNHYNDLPGSAAWLDFALYTEGEIVKELCILCWKTWKGYKPVTTFEPCNPLPLKFENMQGYKAAVRMRRNDWVRRKNQISKTYIEMMMQAESHITILCSYFLPGNIMRKNIKRAIKRGVSIKVVMAGKSDLVVAKNAEKFMYDWLLRNKIAIYEYQNNILHGKIAVCDSKWMTVGSYNLNDISAYASIELNLDVKNPAFAKQVEQTLEEIMVQECKLVTYESHIRSKNLFKQFFRWVSYELFRLGFNLFTFYFKQKA